MNGARLPDPAPEDRYGWDALPIATYRMDEDGELIFMSDRVTELLGYPRERWETAPGSFWFTIVHPDDRERVDREWRECVEHQLPHNSEYRCVHADGHTVWVRELEAIVRDSDGRFLWRQGVTLDVTEQYASERALVGALEQQRRVAELGQQALRGTSSAELTGLAVRLVAEMLDVEVVGILELTLDGELLLAAGEGWPEGAVGQLRLPNDPGTQIGHILRSGDPVLVSDTLLEERFRFGDMVMAMGVRSSIGVRTPGPEGPVGVVGALSVHPRTFSPDDSSFLQAIANILGAAHALETSERERRRVFEALLRSADEERQQIAIELHDDLIQVMTATLILLDRQVKAARALGDAAMVDRAMAARATLTSAVDRTRRLTFELRPPLLVSSGLAIAVTELLAEVAAETGLEAHVEAGIERLPEAVEALAYRTIAELVSNVRKHAAARRVDVALRMEGGALEGRVSDDGSGFDVHRALDRSETRLHIGLDSVAERLRLAGGALEIESRPGAGTRVAFSIPAEPA
jgi:PAS domain S-box-containing protein